MRNIIITGGELFNKGAQAMTFVTVGELKKRFPDHRIWLLSDQDKARPEADKARYAFDFLGWYPKKFADCQKNPLLRAACLLRSRRELLECEEVYRNTDLMVDISGYALGSNWDRAYTGNYLDHLHFARAFGIPVYLMSQSFGPFDFPAGDETDGRIRELLPGVKVICAREQEGYDALVRTYGLTNVVRKPDLVLSSRELDMKAVYRQAPELRLPELAPKSVGIIPNRRNFEVGDRSQVLEFYRTAMDALLAAGNTLYILGHSAMDLTLCRELKGLYPRQERVILLEQEFSCVEFDALVKGFRYLLASRFHSVVHAYKNGVPCVVLGWAVKYRELLEQFGQEAYLFDVRREPVGVEAVLQRMEQLAEGESRTILTALEAVQRENVFDILEC